MPRAVPDANILISALICPEGNSAKICSRVDDDKFIACALEASADYIISGDPRLLNLKHYRDIQIVTPGAFLEILAREKNQK